jgi:hypothetical protein
LDFSKTDILFLVIDCNLLSCEVFLNAIRLAALDALSFYSFMGSNTNSHFYTLSSCRFCLIPIQVVRIYLEQIFISKSYYIFKITSSFL